jgi:hypothetical protein
MRCRFVSVVLALTLAQGLGTAGAGDPPVTPVAYTDAVSREYSALTGPPVTPGTAADAVSRELSTLAGPPVTPMVAADAVSRELSTLAGPPVTPMVTADAVSRELSTLTGPPVTPMAAADAVSRELSTQVGPAPPSVAKMVRPDTGVSLAANVVTASFPGFFYVESPSRSSGIRVDWSGAVEVGSLVEVAGLSAINADSECCLRALAVALNGTGSVGPVLIGGQGLGGSVFAAQPGTQAWDWTNSAVVGVPGLNNVGLLVTICGKVAWTGQNVFIIDDGSGSRFGDPTAPGVRVLLPSGVSIPGVDTWASVTGISSCYQLNGAVYRLLRVRKSEDIRPY